MVINKIIMKHKTFYFGFGSAMDYPDWQNGLSTSTRPDKVNSDHEFDYKNPFRPRLRRLLKKFDKNINIGFNHHTVYVAKGKAIRPVITKITHALIAAGWKLGDFNRNMRVDAIWDANKNENYEN
jgi:hypothetical protein